MIKEKIIPLTIIALLFIFATPVLLGNDSIFIYYSLQQELIVLKKCFINS